MRDREHHRELPAVRRADQMRALDFQLVEQRDHVVDVHRHLVRPWRLVAPPLSSEIVQHAAVARRKRRHLKRPRFGRHHHAVEQQQRRTGSDDPPVDMHYGVEDNRSMTRYLPLFLLLATAAFGQELTGSGGEVRALTKDATNRMSGSFTLGTNLMSANYGGALVPDRIWVFGSAMRDKSNLLTSQYGRRHHFTWQ